MADMKTLTRTKDDMKPAGTGQFVTDMKNKAQEAASSVSQKAEEMVSAIGHKAEDVTAAVGSGMKSLAGTLESGGRYLQEEGLHGIANDLTNLIRRNPIPALLFGIGLGYLIARSTRS